MKRRMLALILAASLAVGMVTACGSGGSSSESSAAGNAVTAKSSDAEPQVSDTTELTLNYS